MRTLFVLFLALPALAFAQLPHWQVKIDPKLWGLAQNPDTTLQFLVIMQEQADLSAAAAIRKKDDKGRFVYETLSALADETQGKAQELLRNSNTPFQSFWIINALWVEGNKAMLEQLAQLPEVGRLEQNPVWHLERPLPGIVDNGPAGDRSFTTMSWGQTKINADDVWNQGYTGSGVVMGGQDTGYEWAHPALKSKYRGWDGSNVDHNYNWHDAIHALINGGSNSCGLNLNHPCDDDMHGTHTMGTMLGGPSIDSTYGIAPDATWIGCRNMEEGDGMPSTYIECFQWFVAPTDLSNQNPDASRAPHVINNSWGCPGSEGCNSSNYATMEGVINNVRSAGIVVVVSAGNDGPGCSTVASPPAIFTSSFAVGATASNDVIASFSSRGPVTVYTSTMKPDISAPGVNIPSCLGHDNNSSTYTYGSLSGTSMAGPHVAGVAALIMSARPDLIGNVDAIENVMEITAVPKFASGAFCGTDNGASHPNNVYGWGRVDALAAINTALPVELLYFRAKKSGSNATLTWATASEADCDRFNIQRSNNGVAWETIGSTACKGNGVHAETLYDFTDNRPLKALNYYRLEQVDFSGRQDYSPVRALSFNAGGYTLEMTTEYGKAWFEVVGENAEEFTWQLDIYSVNGQLADSRKVGFKGWLDVNNLPAGMYLSVLRNTDGQTIDAKKWWWAR